MPDARIIVEGRIASDPRYSATQSGTPVANLRILAGRSRKEQDDSYTTLSTTAYECAFWGAHHDLVANLNPNKGDSVIVTGTIGSLEAYDGKNGTSLSAKVNADGLRVFPKREQQGGSYGQQGGYQQPHQAQPQQSYGAPQGDPWGGGGQHPADPPF